jgi:hypothetical protein
MDMSSGIWNLRSLCRAGSLRTVVSELAKCDLNLVAIRKFRWAKGGSQPADELYIFVWKWEC